MKTIPAACLLAAFAASSQSQDLSPADGATLVNPDVQLKITFGAAPRPGTSGRIRIYDASDDRLVDTLDMSIPAGPTRPVDPAVRARNYLAFPYPYARSARDRKSTRLNSSHSELSRMPSSA